MIPLKMQAIQTALMGDWSSAVLLNQELLKENPDDLETLNRLAFALTIVGKIKDAKKVYHKVLEIDSQNLIALKNLKRLSGSKENESCEPVVTGQINTMFLEETGKTKVIELINTAEPKFISKLMTGEHVELGIKRLKIFISDCNKQYIGVLPGDVSKRLIRFMKGGNTYEACVKSIENHRVVIFIKETKRAARFKNQPSFISVDKSKKNALPNNKRYFVSEPEETPEEQEE